MSNFKIISADDHVEEPRDTWQSRVPAKLRDRAPKVERIEGGGDAWTVDGKVVTKMGLQVQAGRKFEEYKLEGETFETIRPGSYDPHERLKDMDIDGLEAQVLYPNSGFWVFAIDDLELQFACIRAYNDFLAEFCKVNPHRLIGIGLVPTDDVEEGIRETRRIASLGLRGVLLPTFPRSEPLNSNVYDRFWGTAQDLEIPVHVHLGLGDPRARQFYLSEHLRGTLPALVMKNSLGNFEALVTVMFGGVFELFPRLKFVSVEGNIGWLGYFLERADRIYKRHRYWTRLELPNPPSEYFHRQCYATFIEDKIGMRLRDVIGVDNLMWSSDYPHTDTTWPHSMNYIEDTMAGVPPDERRKMARDNAARLYRID
ncbi:MAG TPA: amidohydrolase family protein [Candidatus Binataceae bacterium]|jgi:predicted TIM-barrel fold metal-dependent hydrolase|nr:amidohydrolase family protein [Candidatus Binataceae bacterium]